MHDYMLGTIIPLQEFCNLMDYIVILNLTNIKTSRLHEFGIRVNFYPDVLTTQYVLSPTLTKTMLSRLLLESVFHLHLLSDSSPSGALIDMSGGYFMT